ncbi:hypothetical protein [Thiobacillus denitrificans]|uniref:hypothetical protein n=1 Tax=Thiobacillus denitrificans TaxID=36861 RepID=UPI00036F9E29|nr:hypothetical protein [Thiobacillus denitrificans]
MRRLVAVIIMFIVPLQFAWAAAVGIYGHAGQDRSPLGFHSHVVGHDHQGDAHHDHDVLGNSQTQEHGEDGHHSHVHPVFSSLLAQFSLSFIEAAPDGLIMPPPTGFQSRTPPLLDRPPLVRA